MESIAAALIGIVMMLAGAIPSNSRNRTVIELKTDELTRCIEKHSCRTARAYKLEQDTLVVRRDVDALSREAGWDWDHDPYPRVAY